MEPLNENRTLKLESLISKLPERFRDKVLNVYLFGSRVWRDNPSKREEDLDYDFFMVIDGYSEGEHDIKLEDPLFRDRVDISAFSCEKWNALIRSHQIVYLMCPFLPKVRQYVPYYQRIHILNLHTSIVLHCKSLQSFVAIFFRCFSGASGEKTTMYLDFRSNFENWFPES